MKNDSEFKGQLKSLFVLYSKAPSMELVDIYWRTLQDELTDGEFSFACELAAKQCRYMPRPAELLELVKNAQQAAADTHRVEKIDSGGVATDIYDRYELEAIRTWGGGETYHEALERVHLFHGLKTYRGPGFLATGMPSQSPKVTFQKVPVISD